MSETETQEGQESAGSPSEAPADEKNQVNPAPQRRRRSGRLGGLFLLLVMLGLMAAGYWYYLHPRVLEFVDQYREFESDISSAQDELLDTQEVVSLIRQQLDQQQSIFPRYEAALIATQNELASVAERLREVESSRSGDWVVAEAQYLVRLANQKLLIGTDISSAVDLLSDADDLLFELGYPEARRAREALANDMVRLKQVREVDYQGIYFRLSSLIILVKDLPLPAIQSLEDESASNQEESVLLGWRRWWQAIVSRLEPFFIIRRDSDSGVLLTNDQLELQKLRIQILLHEAQLGLMSSEEEIYRDSLDRAAQLVYEFFGASDQADTLINQLGMLTTRNVRVEVPEITASLRAVQDLGDFLRANPSASQ